MTDSKLNLLGKEVSYVAMNFGGSCLNNDLSPAQIRRDYNTYSQCVQVGTKYTT